MTRRFDVSGQQVEAEGRLEKGRLVVRLPDGPPFELAARRTGDGAWLLTGPDEVLHEVWVARDGAATWVHVDGRTHLVAEVAAGGGAGSSAAGDPVAPMTGTLLDVLVEVGDQVEAGAPVAVLSAMKMEVEVKASVAGRVVALPRAAGEQVAGGDVLVRLEPSP